MGLIVVKKILLKAWLFVGGGVALSACQTAELVFYEHEPSKNFYQNLNIKNPSLKPFFSDGVLFVVDTKSAMENKYLVWLGLFSQEKNKKVRVIKARIFGNNLSKDSIFNTTINIDEPTRKNDLFQNPSDTFKLFEIDSGWINKASGGSGIVEIKVFYEINGREGVMEYKLKRRVEERVIFPT